MDGDFFCVSCCKWHRGTPARAPSGRIICAPCQQLAQVRTARANRKKLTAPYGPRLSRYFETLS